MSMFRSPYTLTQRRQLSQLAEQPNLTLEDYEYSRKRILSGERLFEPPARTLKPDNLLRSKSTYFIFAVLRNEGACTSAHLAELTGYSLNHMRNYLLPRLHRNGLVELNEGRWSLAEQEGQ
jgi:hypothetical protein